MTTITEAEEKAELAERVEQLDKQEQLILALQYTEELTMAEIAKVLDITEKQAEKIRNTALKKLLWRG